MIPSFDTRADAENYRETLHMQGYERSMGYDVVVRRTQDEDGYVAWEVAIHRISERND